MAVTKVPVTQLLLDGVKAAATATPVSAPADGAVIEVQGNTGKLLIALNGTATDGADTTVTIKPGGPSAPRAALGGLVHDFEATAGTVYAVIESARFAQANGDISVSFGPDWTGSMIAYRLPAGS